jgi:hypothetical protein
MTTRVKKIRFTQEQLAMLRTLQAETGAKSLTVLVRLALDLVSRQVIGENFPPAKPARFQHENDQSVLVVSDDYDLQQLVKIGINQDSEIAIGLVFKDNASTKPVTNQMSFDL